MSAPPPPDDTTPLPASDEAGAPPPSSPPPSSPPPSSPQPSSPPPSSPPPSSPPMSSPVMPPMSGPAPVGVAQPAAFPQVLRTPWLNPAKRNQFALLSVLALLVVAAVAFIGGVAVGNGGGHKSDPVRFGRGPAANMCQAAPQRSAPCPGMFGHGPFNRGRNGQPIGPPGVTTSPAAPGSVPVPRSSTSS